MKSSQGVGCNMTQPLPKLQLLQPLSEKKQLTKQNSHESGQE
jgi:hypothetical protein